MMQRYKIKTRKASDLLILTFEILIGSYKVVLAFGLLVSVVPTNEQKFNKQA
jgi:hypothetical protein